VREATTAGACRRGLLQDVAVLTGQEAQVFADLVGHAIDLDALHPGPEDLLRLPGPPQAEQVREGDEVRPPQIDVRVRGGESIEVGPGDQVW
jgi:hypothetical protein